LITAQSCVKESTPAGIGKKEKCSAGEASQETSVMDPVLMDVPRGLRKGRVSVTYEGTRAKRATGRREKKSNRDASAKILTRQNRD